MASYLVAAGPQLLTALLTRQIVYTIKAALERKARTEPWRSLMCEMVVAFGMLRVICLASSA